MLAMFAVSVGTALLTSGVFFLVLFNWLVSVVPLWVSLMILGADAGLIKTAVVSLIGGIAEFIVGLYVYFSYGAVAGALAAYLTWITVLKFAFDLSFIRALIATILPLLLVLGVAFLTGAGAYLLVFK